MRLFALLSFCLLLTCTSARAGTWSTSAWTNDSSTGISTTHTLWAYHFGSGTTATINSFAVPGVAAPPVVIAGKLSVTGTTSIFNNDSNTLTGLGGTGSAVMARDFFHNGNPATVTISGLTAGAGYTVSFFSVGFEAATGVRVLTFESNGDSITVDQNVQGDNKGLRIDYTFVAAASSLVVTIALAPGNTSNTFNLYGVALRDALVVTNAGDSGDGTLREAVLSAGLRSGPDTIIFAISNQTITLTTQITLDSEVMIDGSGQSITIDGGSGTNRVFEVPAGKVVGLTGLTLTGGGHPTDLAMERGGAVYVNQGTLIMNSCTLHHNIAYWGGGGICVDKGSATLNDCVVRDNDADNTLSSDGGGIYCISGTVLLNRCLLANNVAGNGGAIYASSAVGNSTVTLDSCTLTGNRASICGGFVNNCTGSTAAMNFKNCTITGNEGTSTYGAGFNSASASYGPSTNAILTLTHCTVVDNLSRTNGGIGNTQWNANATATLTLTSTIVAGNKTEGSSGADVINDDGTVISTGVNLIGIGDDGNVSWQPADLTGTRASPLPARLAPLGAYGGVTPTRPPLSTSPAVDAAAASAIATDQRGFVRPVDGSGTGTAVADIGAVESSFLQVTTTADELDVPAGAYVSLREAVRDAPASTIISFAPALADQTLALSAARGLVGLVKTLIIDGGDNNITVDGGPGGNNIFNVATPAGSTVHLQALTLIGGGNAAGAQDYGGAVWVYRSTLTLDQCVLRNNVVSLAGGALYAYQSTVALTDCSLTQNTAVAGGYGGAIYNDQSTLVMDRCTLADNQASRGGAFFNQSGAANATLTACTLSGNTSTEDGGGFLNSSTFDTATLTFRNCTLSSNHAGGSGGAGQTTTTPGSPSNTAITTLIHCTVAGNSAVSGGGGLHNDHLSGVTTIVLDGTIVADNTAATGADVYCQSGTVTATRINLIGVVDDSNVVWPPATLTGTLAVPLSPQLEVLGDYGGPTQTMPPRRGSVAVNPIGGETTPPFLTDQRGTARRIGSTVDLGAVEVSILTVTNGSNTGLGSLRFALGQARTLPGPDLIIFNPVVASIVLTSPLVVESDVTVDASDVAMVVSVSGGQTHRILQVSPGISAHFIRLNINGGKATGTDLAGCGGGILVEGSLTLTDCTLGSNEAIFGGGAYVASTGSLTLNRSSVLSNSAPQGAGIYSDSSFLAKSSSFSANTGTSGGAIFSTAGKLVTLKYCTVSKNVATTGGGIVGDVIELQNSIVADNSATTDANLSGSFTATGANLISGDPRLATLGNYGGPTQTMPPLLGSPAIEGAIPMLDDDPIDQRGQPRPLGLRPDIGAVEADVLVVTTGVDELDPPGSPGAGISLREAVRDVPVGGTIVFDRAIFTGATARTNTIVLTKGPLNPQLNCTLDGSVNPGGITILTELQITQQPYAHDVASGGTAIFSVTVTNVSGGLGYEWFKDFTEPPGLDYPQLSIPNANEATLAIPSVQEASEGAYRAIVREVSSPGVLTLVNVVKPIPTVVSEPGILTVDGAALELKLHPESAVLPLGGSYVLKVFAVGPASPALTYQWMKGAVKIPGAIQSTYTISNAKLANAGSYSCVVKSGTQSVSSYPADIVVVDNRLKTVNLKVGSEFTVTINATGRWAKDGMDMGVISNTFTIDAVTPTDAGLYTCLLISEFSSIDVPVRLNVSAAAPLLVKPLSLPAATIGQHYYYQIPVTSIVGAPATRFSVAGALPPGITLNATTGVLSGRPTASKPAGYPLTMKAINAVSSDSAAATLAVNVVPATAVGVFAGPLGRSPLNDNLGGRFDLTTTGTGTFSGSITLGARRKLSFTTKLLQSAGAGDAILYGAIPGIAMADKTPLIAYVEVFVIEQVARLTLVHPNGDTLQSTAWRKTWLLSKTVALNNPATAYAAYYTMRLNPQVLGASPRGYGYSSFTVSTAGALTLAGKLPDGSAITGGTFVGPDGQILLFNLLYGTTNRGSHVGEFIITPATPVANNVINGTPSWFKPAPLPNSKDTIYKDGFGPLTVTAVGSPYLAPAKGQRVMELPAVLSPATNGELAFTLGGLDTESKEFTQLVRISNPSATGLTNTVAMGPTVLNSTKMSVLTASSGLFSGSFTIPGATVALNRPAPFYGQMVKIGAATQGYGYFLLPKVPVGTEKVTTSPKLSGRVVLQ